MQDNQDSNKIAQLEKQLRDSVAAEAFFNQSSGKLVVELLTAQINVLMRQITSDKFKKDHMGYVNALAELQANQKLLKRLQVAANPEYQSKVRERLAEEEAARG